MNPTNSIAIVGSIIASREDARKRGAHSTAGCSNDQMIKQGVCPFLFDCGYCIHNVKEFDGRINVEFEVELVELKKYLIMMQSMEK